jgi:hypothetical protein
MSDPDAKEFRRLALMYVEHYGVEDTVILDTSGRCSRRGDLMELKIWVIDGCVSAVLFPEGGGNCQIIHDHVNEMSVGGERLRADEKVRQPYLEALRSALVLEQLADV